MNRIKFREAVLLAISLAVAINFIYFRYIYKSYITKRNTIINEINNCNKKAAQSISYFNKNLDILKKIVLIKKEILISKRNIELLKNNRISTFDMSNILKTLLVRSGVSVYNLSLSDIRNKNSKKIYSFKIEMKDSLKRILKFMDLIEGYSDNMYISHYTLKPKDGSYNVSMTVNFDYVSAR